MNIFFKRKKFPEPLTTTVFTTIHVMKEDSLITLISHELDGAWQFMGNEPIVDVTSMAMVVSLEQVIQKIRVYYKLLIYPWAISYQK